MSSPLILVKTPEIEAFAEAHFGLMGIFTLELTHARTGLVKRRIRFQNLLTDAGLNALGNGTLRINTALAYLAVGTGSNAPAVTDVALQNEIIRTNANGGFPDTAAALDGSQTYYSLTTTRVFTESQANGNLTELGFYNLSNGGILFNRQLFKDVNNNPITITKTNQDQLKVIFELRLYPDKNVHTNVITVTGSGVETTFNTRVASFTSWGGPNSIVAYFGIWNSYATAFESNVMPAIDAAFSNTGGVTDQAHSWLTYGNGNFYRDLRSSWEPGYANFATGIGMVKWWFANGGDYNNQGLVTTLNPKAAKDNVKRFTFTGRVSWARV